MKKEFIPIAMKCNKEQFEAIKPYINKEGFHIKHMSEDFDRADYLCNFAWGEKETISNFTTSDYKNFNREVHETWNERIFLNACGIEKKEHFEITKETIFKYKMKDEFPEVFDVELEVGNWYRKMNTPFIYHILEIKDKNNIKAYGFDSKGEYSNTNKFNWGTPAGLTRATEQEVFEALKNEAVRRGFVDGSYIKLEDYEGFCRKNEDSKYFTKHNCFDFLGRTVFDNGIWAKIIPTKTKEEAEKLLGVKIID